jgi:recombination protein RecT
MVAMLDCARLGHEPGTPAYYFVPIKGAIEGWEGYRGVIERIYRAGAVQSVRAAVVRENDFYEYEEGMPHADPPLRAVRPAGEAGPAGRCLRVRGDGRGRHLPAGRDGPRGGPASTAT